MSAENPYRGFMTNPEAVGHSWGNPVSAIVSGMRADSAGMEVYIPPNRTRLFINRWSGGNSIRIDSPAPMPNAWRRFWHWALLGWEWEDLEKKE